MTDGAPRIIPQPRIDTVAYDPTTRESRRRTEYSGSIWFGEPPSVRGTVVMTSGGAEPLQAAFFIPDSLPYQPDAAATVQIAATLALQSGGSSRPSIVSDYRAVLAPDPRGQAIGWLQLQLVGVAAHGTALSYRIVVLAPPGAVAS